MSYSDTRGLAAPAGGLTLVLLGVSLAVIHVTHILQEEEAVALLIGGVIPLLLAAALVAVGGWLARSPWSRGSTRRLLAWLALGMVWMMVAGVGAMIYETVEVTSLSHTGFLVAIFATYGAIPGLITGYYDVQRYRRQERLAVQEEAMASAIDGIGILDAAGRYRYLNDAHAAIHGYDDPEALVGESWRVFYGAAEIERFESEILPRLRSEGRWRGRATGRREDGSRFPQRLSLTALEDGGTVWNVRDISDEVDRELAFTVLNRVLRHNLSNDINVVMGQAERIQNLAAGEVARAATRIEETGAALAELAEKERQIADLVLRNPEPAAMSLESVVAPAVETISQQFPQATVEIADPTDVDVAAIPELEQALVELLENGVIHAEDSAPVVEVAIEQAADTVTLAVRDEGPGIPEQDRAVVAGRQEIDALFHASGLGLWYVYWVMRNLGGEVSFSDREPSGSEVGLTLQRAEDES